MAKRPGATSSRKKRLCPASSLNSSNVAPDEVVTFSAMIRCDGIVAAPRLKTNSVCWETSYSSSQSTWNVFIAPAPWRGCRVGGSTFAAKGHRTSRPPASRIADLPCHSIRVRLSAIEHVFHRLIASAGRLLEPPQVQDPDLAPRIADDLSASQRAGGLR